MYQEKYSLRWHSYSDHLKSMMRELMMNEEFSDVTLVTEDKKQIKANVIILSACSPIFKDILKKEKNSNTTMYLRGIQYSEMESIMQFMYLGEAKVYQERLDELLAVAKSLEIKELCVTETETNDKTEEENIREQTIERREVEDDYGEIRAETNNEPDGEHSSVERDGVKLEEKTFKSKSDQIKEEPAQKRKGANVSENSKYYECGHCHKIYTSKRSLFYHKQSFHEEVKFTCDQCDFQGNTPSYLTRHIQAKHKGIKHACDQCDYQTADRGGLTKHIQAKHKNVKYYCDQCEQKFQYTTSLKRHIQSTHESIIHACDQCGYQATQQQNLRHHIKMKHKVV